VTPTVEGSLTGQQSGSTSLSISLAGVDEGEFMHVSLTAGDVSTGVTLPDGWEVLAGPTTSTIGSRRTWVLGKIKEAGDTAFVVAKAGTLVTRALIVHGTGAQDPSAWQVGTFGKRANAVGTSTTSVAPSIDTAEDDTLVLASIFEATSAEDTTPQTLSGTGWELVAKIDDDASPDTTFIEQVLVAKKAMASAGTTGDATVTYQNSQANNGGGIQVALTAGDAPASPTVAVWDGENEVEATVAVWDGENEVPAAAVIALPESFRSYTVSDMEADFDADATVYWAHRGGSLDWSEMTMRAYTNAIFHGVKVLEYSAYLTSDGVFVGMHDATVDRTTALTGAVSSLAWASLEGVAVDAPVADGGTVSRVEDILETYGRSHVIVLEDKTYTNLSALLDIVEGILGEDATEHVIVKSVGIGTSAVPIAAHARGFKTWGYYYGADAPGFTNNSNYDYLGMDYAASSGEWSSITALGKPVIGHVVPDLTAANTCLSRGAKGLQVSGVTAVVPALNAVP
jgi:hypothetical protein